jgi:beta-galactosidase/beta-glucuronidase
MGWFPFSRRRRRKQHTYAGSKQHEFLYEDEIKSITSDTWGDAWIRVKRALACKHPFTEETLFSCVAYETFSYDNNYGADADGNRGVGMWFSEDTIIESWFIDGVEVNESDIPQYIRHSLEKQAMNYVFEPNEIYEPDPDFGRDER